MDDLRRRFSRRLRELREAAGLTQEDLAEAAGTMSLSYVGALERGDKSASLETVERLARGLGVDPAEFFKGGPRRNRLSAQLPPEERLGRLVIALAKGTDDGAQKDFESIARAFFSTARRSAR